MLTGLIELTGFSDTLAAYHDGSSGEGRPEKYESQEKAWGNKGGLPSVWGQKSKLHNGTKWTLFILVDSSVCLFFSLRWYHGKWR